MTMQDTPNSSSAVAPLAQSGLSTLRNPMAEELMSKGRGQDSMLVHMTPNEVNSLQGLAMSAGGSLTINPDTGLPEAGFLSSLLPVVIGGALAATGIGAPLAAGIVGLGNTALTGSLKQGLMAGLSAYGGAGLAGAAGLGGAVSQNAFGLLGDKAGLLGANMGLGATGAANLTGATGALTDAGRTAAQQAVAQQAATTAGTSMQGFPELAQQAASQGAGQVVNLAPQAPGFSGNFMSRFGQATRAGLPTSGIGGMVARQAPMAAGLGVLSAVSGASASGSSGHKNRDGTVDNSYQGPYYAQQRPANFAPNTQDLLNSSAERDYFTIDQPEIYNGQGQIVQPGSNTAPGTEILHPMLNPDARKGENMYSFATYPWMMPQEQYAAGGTVNLSEGAFVVDARTVSELGNGSSGAGQELLSRFGGHPVRGPGDGVSDSIPARIGGDQPARVARDEVVLPPQAVKRIGGGNMQRGANKLYAMMDRAREARQSTRRGHDNKMQRGLA